VSISDAYAAVAVVDMREIESSCRIAVRLSVCMDDISFDGRVEEVSCCVVGSCGSVSSDDIQLLSS
jgi:hypothetical protein